MPFAGVFMYRNDHANNRLAAIDPQQCKTIRCTKKKPMSWTQFGLAGLTNDLLHVEIVDALHLELVESLLGGLQALLLHDSPPHPKRELLGRRGRLQEAGVAGGEVAALEPIDRALRRAAAT